MEEEKEIRKTPLELIEGLDQLYTLNLIDLVEWNVIKLEEMHPIDMMAQIDAVASIIERYSKRYRTTGKKKNRGVSKAKWILIWQDIEGEFGIWSHHFNKVLRSKIANMNKEDEDEDIKNLRSRFVYVYAYWWNTYHLVTEALKKRSKIAGSFSRKHIMKGRHTLTRLINEEIDINQVSSEFRALIDKLEALPFETEIKKSILSKTEGDK